MNIRRRRDPAGDVVIGRSACLAKGLDSAISTFGVADGRDGTQHRRGAAIYKGDCLRHVGGESGEDKRGLGLARPKLCLGPLVPGI